MNDQPYTSDCADPRSTLKQRFEALLHEHRKIVFKIAGAYAFTEADRGDLAQEICTQLWRAFPRYDETRRFSTWMFRVALNVGISHARQERHHAERLEPIDDQPEHMLAGDSGPAETVEMEQRLRLLQTFIAGLEPLDRALILLYLEERGYAEIADVLGISETNVATKINRLKQRLRDRMTAPAPKEKQHGTR